MAKNIFETFCAEKGVKEHSFGLLGSVTGGGSASGNYGECELMLDTDIGLVFLKYKLSDVRLMKIKGGDVAPEFIIGSVRDELNNATTAWPPFNSAHEGFAVLKEEVDELWDHVKTNQKRRDLDAMKKEAVQVAAMAIRFALEVCDEKRGRK